MCIRVKRIVLLLLKFSLRPPIAGRSVCVCSSNVQKKPMDNKLPAVPGRSLAIKSKPAGYKDQLSTAKIEMKSDEKPWTLSEFDVGCSLGKYGNVFIAREKQSDYVVALKVLEKSQIDSEIEHHMLRVVDIQIRLRHPNILRMYGYFHNEQRIYLILEYAKHGSLFKLLDERKHFDEKTTAIYLRDLTKALIFCHSKQVIQRDIKPEKILIGRNWAIKIADFASSVHSPPSRRMTLCGTFDYLSPEMIEGRPHSYAVDIWSLGVLCYELLVGLPPFNAKVSGKTFRNKRDMIINYPGFVSEKAKDLMGQLLVINPEERLPLTHVLKHPWILENAPDGAQPPVFGAEQK